MKRFINFINPFVGYIILPPFFTVYNEQFLTVDHRENTIDDERNC